MKSRKRSWLSDLIFPALLLLSAASARTVFGEAYGAGTSGADILTTPISARAVGMGGAFAAVSDDVSAIHWNPAGLALIQRQQASTMYLKGLVDTKTEFLGYAAPLPSQLALSQTGISAVGASVLLSQLGNIEYLQTDSNGVYLNNTTLSAGSAEVFSLAYGAMISRESLSRLGTEENYIGVSARYLMSTLAQSYSARTAAFDLGYMNLWKESGMRWGFVVQNMGPQIKYQEQGDPLPLTGRLGIAWQHSLPEISASPLTLAVDGILDREKKRAVHAGIEYWLNGLAAFRAGYQIGQSQTGGWSTGIGLKLSGTSVSASIGNLIIDYGLSMMGDLGNAQRVSISVEFGGGKDSRAQNFTTRY